VPAPRSWPDSTAELCARVARLDRTRRVEEVLARMRHHETRLDGYWGADGGGPEARRRRRPLPDGVACFNGLYLKVTEAVAQELPLLPPEVRRFVLRLDVVFAEFYFHAFEAAAAGEWVPKAWAPLFERKDAAGVLPLQFALAGMNAHINNDLALALVQVWREQGIQPRRGSPEHQAYVRVDALLARVQREARAPLADPFVAAADHALGDVDDFLALWNVGKARQEAWNRAVVMARDPEAEWPALWDRAIGFVSHLLLAPVLR
jgi:hypothetical protein